MGDSFIVESSRGAELVLRFDFNLRARVSSQLLPLPCATLRYKFISGPLLIYKLAADKNPTARLSIFATKFLITKPSFLPKLISLQLW